jgi:protein-S-isoprenylcysteine O-methyltransferase Ste14
MKRWLALLQVAAIFAFIAGVLFLSAGQTALPMFWAYLGVMTGLMLMTLGGVYRQLPEILQEQRRSGQGERDRITGPTLVVLLFSHWLIAGLDAGQFHWSGHVPANLQVVGLMIAGGGISLLAWSVIFNRYYSSRVNIQTDRGQKVITTGPYRFVRHPGYSGWILFMMFSGVALGSWIASLPTLVLAGLIIRRTVIEDRMLQDNLTGYTEYSRKVHYRLIPGLW